MDDMELEQILRLHAEKYPLMQPTDAVKLIFQNEFGGGHLIRQPDAALEYLRREYDKTEKDSAAALLEPLGNGIVRVNLAALPQERLEELGQAFLRSAPLCKGSRERFLQKLQILRLLTAQGLFGFDAGALEEYLAWYEGADFPAVSHSQSYRENYCPAYRVVLENLF